MEAGELERALNEYRSAGPQPLLGLLGYEAVGFRIPNEALGRFGLDPREPITLELTARHGDFPVLRIGFQGRLDPAALQRTAAALYRHNPARRALLLFESADDRRLVLASWGLGPGPLRLRKVWIDTREPRASELDILAALAADAGTTASDLALAHCRALDREQVTRRFFNEFRQRRAELATSLRGIPAQAQQDRADVALILLSRLLFLYFIQRKGWLAGDTSYLRHLYEDAVRSGTPFFRRRLRHLFFGALNRPAAKRSAVARSLGELPFLNGGLFERDSLEQKYCSLDVPDDAFVPVIYQLLDRYQFTLREDTPGADDVAVDPEMLGKVFEGLMSVSLRSTTGAFFTPRTVVDGLVCQALSVYLTSVTGSRGVITMILNGDDPHIDEGVRKRLCECLKRIRVLDPAVGSGAFLLAGLRRLENLRDYLEGPPDNPFGRFERRQDIIRRNLYGVDVNGAAVRLCELRLWLALIVDLEVDNVAGVPPLPNLDLNIRQGDALVDPIDFLILQGDLDYGRLTAHWRKELDRLARRRRSYFSAVGPGKRRAERAVRRAERDLASGFLAEVKARLQERLRELRAIARSRDLFGGRVGLNRSQRARVAELGRRRNEISRLLRRLRDADELPFFSFAIHFGGAQTGASSFHVIVGNPPWVRTHHWAGLSRQRLRERFACLRGAGWRMGSRLAGAGRGFGAQLDLSALFLERSLDLLAENGSLGLLLPAKLVRALSGGALRRLLLGRTEILQLDDRSLAASPLFEATNYPLALILRNSAPSHDARLTLRIHDRRGAAPEFQLPQHELPLLPHELESPWVLAPPAVRAAMTSMQAAGPPLGSLPGRRPRRGVFTGANEIFLGEVLDPHPVDGCLRVSIAGEEVLLELERLRPALRGTDLASWDFSHSKVLLWTHDDHGHPLPSLPPAVERYLSGRRQALGARVDLRSGQPPWTIFRARAEKWALRVAWRDIGLEPCAVVVPARLSFFGRATPAISLNTVYQIPAASATDAHLLAAVLNSTVSHAYLKAIAERAAGGYFRFLGWTVALLPFPERPDVDIAERCAEFSQIGHQLGALDRADQRRLDQCVGRLYGLAPAEIDALSAFDARMRRSRE